MSVALSRVRSSSHLAPVACVIAAFVASRVWAWEAGVRFDSSSLPLFWQYLDPGLLKTKLVESVWYLHAQPPLYNLLLGIDLKIFGSSFGAAAHGVHIALGVGMAASLYALCILLQLPRWWAAAVATLFTVSPAMLVYENWLFYEYLVAALLLFAAIAFAAFKRKPSAGRSAAVFGLLVAVCFIRASFQIVLPLLVLAFMLAAFPGNRRKLVVGAAVPILLLAGLSVKNWILFGNPSTSSWAGMNLMQIDQAGFRGSDEQNLQRRGVISPISALPVFAPLDTYASIIPPRTYGSIPALDDTEKTTGAGPNYNNVTYVAISDRYMHDFGEILLHAPTIYLRGVWEGLTKATYPSTDYYFFLGNRSKIEPWTRGYDAVILGQPHVRWVESRPEGTAWGIVVAYIVALVAGAVEMWRVLRRRGGSLLAAFLWLVLAYATLTMTFGEVAENQRIRFVGDPLATVLVAWVLKRLVCHGRARRAVMETQAPV